MISSCCTFRLNRRSALSMDSPSCTFTSAKLDYTPFAADFDFPSGPRVARGDLQLCMGRLEPSEYGRLSQTFADPRRIQSGISSTIKLLAHSHLRRLCAS